MLLDIKLLKLMTRISINKKQFKARALFLGERIDLRALENAERLAVSPLVVSAGAEGCVVILRYGVIVLFNVEPLEEVSFINHIKPLVTEKFENFEIEEANVVIDPNKEEAVSSFGVILSEASYERLQILAEILAKSVVLAHYEAGVAEVFDRVEPFANELQNFKGRWNKGKELLRHIGRTLLIHHKMVGRVEVGEKPDLLWNHPELERFYLRLEDEYELKERHVALERKLELILRIVETLNDLLHSNRSMRLEWYVIILILVEIILTLYEMFIKHQ